MQERSGSPALSLPEIQPLLANADSIDVKTVTGTVDLRPFLAGWLLQLPSCVAGSTVCCPCCFCAFSGDAAGAYEIWSLAHAGNGADADWEARSLLDGTHGRRGALLVC